jgi:transposase, IS30 family
MAGGKKLDKAQRTQLYKLQRMGGLTARCIAQELGVHHSTVLREIERSSALFGWQDDYYTQAQKAQEASHQRRVTASKKKMRLKSGTIRHYVDLHLREAQWSPEIIAGKLTLMGYPISAEAIYQWINIERPDLKSSLLIAGRSRRRRRAVATSRGKPQAAAPKRSVELYTDEAKKRESIGHLELDAMHGKQGGRVVQNKIDRRSRKMFLDFAPCLEAKPYADLCLERLKRDIPLGVLKSILQDNGAEHSDHLRLEQELKILTYFCHPYSASERGTVENRNKALRRFLPKGSDFEGIPDEFLEWVEDYYNNRPMKVLGFKTPNAIWNEGLLAKAA